MELDHLRYETHDGVAEIVLDRPEVLNALSAGPGGTRDQILAALAEAGADPAVGAVVLHGAGRAFCSGGDLTGNARRETAAEELAFLERADAFHEAVRGSAVPVVAAVHGLCLGAGVSLAAACDLVLAADDARFGFPEGRMGLVGAGPITTVVGRQWAKFLILTGELLDADQAQALGLVLTVEPAAELLDRAFDLAARIARMPREAVLLNRRSIDAIADAAGDAASRPARLAHDTVTLSMAASATAPDGRRFREILDAEGMAGVKTARDQQYTNPWLRPRPPASSG
ncbi:MAG: enoyl-CoA hydratase [Acidimicrobiia bacterium]